MKLPRSRAMLLAVLACLLAARIPDAAAARKTSRSAPAAAPALAQAAEPRFAPPPTAVDVKVERVRPHKETYATLRFLKENRDFLRSRFDRLKETPEGKGTTAAAVDPRFLSYQQMLAEVRAAEDTLSLAEEARRKEELFASITDLGRLESQLDLMGNLLDRQRGRLAVLEADFAGRQQTMLSVVVTGLPAGASVDSLVLTLEDGARNAVGISADQREVLRHGGVLQVFRGLVEPREQVLEVAIEGGAGLASEPGFVTLDPARDRLTFLRLDLAKVQAGQGAATMTASTWVLDDDLHANHGDETEP